MSNHDERGRFVKGNVASLVHGARSRQVEAGTLEEQAEALLAMCEARETIVSHLGGDSELSQLQQDIVTKYLRLGLIETFAFDNIRKAGVFTTTGKQRSVRIGWQV